MVEIILSDFNDQNNLTAAEVDSSIYIRVNGRGSFRNSPALKEYVKKQLSDKSSKKIFIDMNCCVGMDSTFMGVLAGLAGLTKKTSRHSFSLINLSKKNEKLLITLGVSKIVNYTSSNNNSISKKIEEDDLSVLPSNQNKTTQVSLDAHKKLIEIDPSNKKEFKSVIELLEKDLKKSKEKKW